MYAKKNALCTKTLFKNTRILIFCYKIYPYFSKEQKEELLEKISDYFTKIDTKYIKFIKYFNKIWKNNNLLNFNQFSEVKYKFRTNNYIERYHLLLNEVIENYHPKMPFYLDKLKNIIINYYNNYISNLTTFNNNEVYQYKKSKI